MKHIIDIDAWERRDNYGFFRSFVNSWYSVTTEIDCTEASAAARAAKRSFFLYYLYAVVRSANEVDELRYRTDKEGRVVFHDRVDIISPIAVPGKTFYTVRIPYYEDFERFYAKDSCRARRLRCGPSECGSQNVFHLDNLYTCRSRQRLQLSVDDCRQGRIS